MLLRGILTPEMLLPFGSGSGDGFDYSSSDGTSYGDGYGSSNGSSDGTSYGTSSSDGTGYSDGYGSSNGSGDGTSYGDGYSSSNGSSDGSGDGSGSSNGYASLVYWFLSLQKKAIKYPDAIVAYWCSNSDGTPANGGGGGTKAAPGLIENVSGPLRICTKNALHGTFLPMRWRGDRIWVVAMYPPFQVEEDKIASLKRAIICEAEFSKGKV